MPAFRLAFGSDVAAGPELNMWRVMRSAIEMQKARSFYDTATRPLNPAQAFYLATHGGARALGKSNTIGTLDVAKDADLTVVDLSRITPYNRDAECAAEEVVALCVYRGEPAGTKATFVRGRCVYEA